MYGANPAIYRNLSAAILVARGYAMEEGVCYCVMTKTTDVGKTWYKAVMTRDIETAQNNGYSVCVSSKCIEDVDDSTEYDDVVWDPTIQNFKVTK